MSNETKHTPGPWNIGKVSEEIFATDENGIPRTICQRAEDDEFEAKPWEANAHLIASAPELLEACKDALESLKRLEDKDGAYRVTNISQLQQAIAKAEGH